MSRTPSRKARAWLLGGKRHALGGTFYEPTVLTDVTTAMQLAQEETFGPVAPLFRFRDEAEAIAIANGTPFGLGGLFLYARPARAWRVAEALEYGIVGVNEGIISTRARAVRRRQAIGPWPGRLPSWYRGIYRVEVHLHGRP